MKIMEFVLTILWIGIGLMSVGSITEVTYDLARGAAQHEFISIGKWNRMLHNDIARVPTSQHRSLPASSKPPSRSEALPTAH